jgi:hypothetical protein
LKKLLEFHGQQGLPMLRFGLQQCQPSLEGGDRRIGHGQAAREPLSAVFFGRLAAG